MHVICMILHDFQKLISDRERGTSAYPNLNVYTFLVFFGYFIRGTDRHHQQEAHCISSVYLGKKDENLTRPRRLNQSFLHPELVRFPLHLTSKLALSPSDSLESPEMEAMSSDHVDIMLLDRLHRHDAKLLAK